MLITLVETLLFDYSAENFETWDVPDVPTRAYRDVDGLVHLIQSHFINRASVGPDFESLTHGAPIIFQGSENPDYSAFDYHVWIAGTYTLDGQTIYAIAHVENYTFGANGVRTHWFNTIIGLVSTDKGATWAAQTPRLVASIPFKGEDCLTNTESDGHDGYFEPTNIFKGPDGAYYFFANVVSPDPLQLDGNCLMRSTTLKSNSWRGWFNGTFVTKVGADPYLSGLNPDTHRCTPIAMGFQARTVVKHVPSGLYIAVGNAQKTVNGNLVPGQYYSTSADLITWSGPKLLLADNRDKHSTTMDHVSAYPALIDPNSTSRNFDTIEGEDALLTFVRVKLANGATTTDRDIVAFKVKISL